ncbi:hypothetical protein ACOSQ2_019480 [Xanthoceras sorbifolium]
MPLVFLAQSHHRSFVVHLPCLPRTSPRFPHLPRTVAPPLVRRSSSLSSSHQSSFSSSSSHQSSSSSFSSSPLPRSTALHPQLIFPTPPLVHRKKALLSSFNISIMASKKIADAKLAKDFQAVLQEFQKAQRLAAERETTYIPFVPQAVLSSSYTAQELDISSDKSTETACSSC